LIELNLGWNQIGNEGMRFLSEGLRENTVLIIYFSLYENFTYNIQ